MGVPKFFRYISERYPCLSELAREQHIPDFDNLYLDMNGIIHNCSHPDDGNIHFKLSEADMFSDIYNYIEKLFFLIKPQKLFFMAIDGVAPRAKMNQQRSRRFRSAKESELLTSHSQQRGEELPENRFDSNCITPGTEFMERLHAGLQYFIKYKISCDPLWQKCRIILSGHDSPGEGEHKIMDYIRYLKSKPDYNPYTRHCLYGLDADLIILGLCTHELHFAVLREEVKFGKKSKTKSVESTRFFLLHLGLLREYLELEFNELKEHDKNFDVANLIDDWILMGFLVGNDFVPHLPCLHIQTNALPLLYKTYIKVYPQLGGNINEHGKLNLARLEQYFEALSEVEYNLFQENWTDLKYFEMKKAQNDMDETFDVDINEIKNGNMADDLQALIDSSKEIFSDDEDIQSLTESEHIAEEHEKYKQNYYMDKLNDMNGEEKRNHALSYITALQWILDYYYRGVQSWDWYYPYHYAPFISDLKNFKDFEIKLQMGKPFLPFAQLLAVLPAASKKLLPEAYHELMTNENSELQHFYPLDFKTDLNGKQHEWEAVVLIPFIDEKLLLKAMESCESKLTTAERRRNCHGPMYQYDYSTESLGELAGNDTFPAIRHVFCREQPIWAKDIAVNSEGSVCVELANLMRHVFFPGFPTFKHLDFDFELRSSRVRVFDFASRNENMILLPKEREHHDDLEMLAQKYLNKVVYIGWPHLIKALVVSISNSECTINSAGSQETDAKTFKLQVQAAQEHLQTRMGIELPDYKVLLHVNIHEGSSKVICSKTNKLLDKDTWSKHVTSYPAQAVVADIAVHDSKADDVNSVEKYFAPNSMVFFTGSPYYGSQGVIIDPMMIYQCGRLQVQITVLAEPNLTEARMLQNYLDQDFLHAVEVANLLGISTKCLGKLTGSVLVIPGERRIIEKGEQLKKTNIGLELRFLKKNEERADFSRRVNSQWFYSNRAISLIQDYMNRYMNVIEYLSRSSERTDFCFESDLFVENATAQVNEIAAWLKQQPHFNAECIPCGGQLVSKETVIKLLESLDQLKNLPVKTVKLQVKPHLLLKPDVSLPSSYKSKCSIRLFDRVIIVKTTYMVPLGSKGTVIGIFPIRDPNPVRLECVGAVELFYEILFDKPLISANDVYGLAQNQVYRVPESAILLIYTQESNGERNQAGKSSVEVKTSQRYTKNNEVNNHKKWNNTNWREPETVNRTTNKPQPTEVPHPIEGANFWLPAESSQGPKNKVEIQQRNVERNEENTNKTFRPSQQQPQYNTMVEQPTTRMPTSAVNDCEVKSMTLRNALGINSSFYPSFVNHNKTQVLTLPQPPQFWKNEARMYKNNNTNNYNWRVPNNVTPTLQQNMNMPQTYSKVVQNTPVGFVPLQVMRKTVPTIADNKSSEVNKLNEAMQKSTLNATIQTRDNQNQNHNSIANTSDIKTPVCNTKPKQRVPRTRKIGAKFDMA